MTVAIKLNTAERIRRAKASDPSATDDQLREQLGVTAGQIKAALAYKGMQQTGHRRAG